MALYYISTYNGCGIREAATKRKARAIANRESGSLNVKEVRKATDRDIAWVRAMGGYVPNSAERTTP